MGNQSINGWGLHNILIQFIIKLQILESEILYTTIKGKPSLTQDIWPEMLISIVLVKILITAEVELYCHITIQ